MIRIAATYPRTAGKKFDLDLYIHKHLPWVRQKFGPYGLKKIEVDQGVEQPGGGVSPFFAIGYLYFDSLENFRKAFAAVGAEVVARRAAYTDVVPVVQIGEVMELREKTESHKINYESKNIFKKIKLGEAELKNRKTQIVKNLRRIL